MTAHCSNLNLISVPDYLKTALRRTPFNGFEIVKTLAVEAQKRLFLALRGLT